MSHMEGVFSCLKYKYARGGGGCDFARDRARRWVYCSACAYMNKSLTSLALTNHPPRSLARRPPPRAASRMKSHTFSTTLVSLLATVANSTAGDHEAGHRSSPPAAAFTALAPLPAPTTPYRFGSSGGRRWRSTRTSSRSRPAISGRHLPEAGFNSRRIHFVGGAAAAGSGLEMTRAAASGLAGGLTWRRRQQQRRRWGQGGGRQQGRGWFAQSAAAAQPSPSSSSFGWPEGGGQWAEEEDRCIRRLDTAVSERATLALRASRGDRRVYCFALASQKTKKKKKEAPRGTLRTDS